MDEFEIIKRCFDRRVARDDVRLGIGDDGAVTEAPPGKQLVSVLDTIVDGVHFPHRLDAGDVGYRAVAVNLSDLAAMGAEPCWMLLGLTLPQASAAWLEAFAEGLYTAAGEHDVALIGGDTTRGGQAVITVQMTGLVEPERYLTRSGARAGDTIWVSGTPGDAAAGLALVAGGARQGYLAARFRRPTPRVALGRALVGVASAAIDVSDGLYADLARLLEASGHGGTLACERVPLSAELERHAGPEEALSSALGGGDDYELCFTVPPERERELEQGAARAGVEVTRIGRVEAHAGLRCTRDGRPFDYRDPGYRHFYGQVSYHDE